jgi:hypothetical protein
LPPRNVYVSLVLPCRGHSRKRVGFSVEVPPC